MAKTFYFSLVILATIPIYFAAVQEWVWTGYTVAIGLIYIFNRWTRNDAGGPGPSLWAWCIWAFFAWALVQCIPLPGPLLKLLTPLRFDLLQQTAEITGNSSSWASISYSAFNSFAWWIFLLALALFYTVLKDNLTSKYKIHLMMVVLLVLVSIEALYGIVQALVPSVGVFWSDVQVLPRSRGTFINRNHYAGFVEMVFPLILGFSISFVNWGKLTGEKSRKLRLDESSSPPLLLGVVMVSVLVSLLFSQSRAGIMGFGVGFFVFAILVRLGVKRMPVGFLIGIGVVIGITLFYGARIGFDSIIDRFLRIDDDTARLEVWMDAMVMVKDHPFGTGLLSFQDVFPLYKSQIVANKFFDHAHNDVLQLLIETGWIGFIAFMSGFFIFIFQNVRRLIGMHPEDDPLRFFLSVGAISGLASIFFHSFFDFNLQIPANCLYFVMLMAILSACVNNFGKTGKRETRTG
jgi:O-antigen ligase